MNLMEFEHQEIGFWKMSGVCKDSMLVLGRYWFPHKARGHQS